MTYSEAIDKCINHEKVRRAIWDWFYFIETIDNIIYLKESASIINLYKPCEEDKVATDWEIYKE